MNFNGCSHKALCMCRPNLISEQTCKAVTNHAVPPQRRVPIEVSESTAVLRKVHIKVQVKASVWGM